MVCLRMVDTLLPIRDAYNSRKNTETIERSINESYFSKIR